MSKDLLRKNQNSQELGWEVGGATFSFDSDIQFQARNQSWFYLLLPRWSA